MNPGDPPGEPTVIYRDARVVVVRKPSGWLVHRGYGTDRVVLMTTVRDMVGCWVYPAHRLDRGTSGAVVFGLDPEAAAVLGAAFEAGAVTKRYLAVVRGRLEQGGVLDYPVPRSDRGERIDAVTAYEPLLVLDRFTIAEARPKTGRFRQIRRHFKHLGHPIVLDKRHGRGDFQALARDRYGFDRMALHAHWLTVPHPEGGRLTVRAPFGDLAAPLTKMGFDVGDDAPVAQRSQE